MKRIFVMLMSFLLIFISSFSVGAESLGISAHSYALYCANNGEVLKSHNENEKMKMASTTKIMTSLLTLECSKAQNKRVLFTDEMVTEGSSMYLKKGEVVTLFDLAVGMMTVSGNDAANAAAITLSGSTEKFSTLMNERAAQLGMKNTHFVTPSGLDDDNHYSTAYDMAILMSYAMENEDFAKITSQKSMTVKFLTPADKQITYQNHNRLLRLYDSCIGGKTGFTKAAGRCLVTCAERDNLRLVAVTLSAPNDWDDHMALYDYGFENYAAVPTNDSKIDLSIGVVGGESDNVCINAKFCEDFVTDKAKAQKVVRTVYAPQFVYAPVEKGQQIGMVTYTLDSKIIHQNVLYAQNEVKALPTSKGFWDYIEDIF